MNIERPSEWVLDVSFHILDYIKGKSIPVEFVNPSHDGGIVIEVYKNAEYHLLEVYNDKDIVYLIKAKEGTRVYDTNKNDILTFLEKFLH